MVKRTYFYETEEVQSMAGSLCQAIFEGIVLQFAWEVVSPLAMRSLEHKGGLLLVCLANKNLTYLPHFFLVAAINKRTNIACGSRWFSKLLYKT